MAKKPLITIVGVPNTGKSTLFNRLIGKRKALVHSQAGMTRDIYKKDFEIDGVNYDLQDSGGFFPNQEIITDEINKRIFREAGISDLILFLFDGRRELLGYEQDLFLEIRKINQNIIPIINKVDNPDKFILPNSYYALKQDLLMISAEHNLEVETLLEPIRNFFGNRTGGESRWAGCCPARTRLRGSRPSRPLHAPGALRVRREPRRS
ncbi:MAG: GTP-binding protein [bacterium]|nr:GTP-binding protein [bacterium]